MSGGGQESCETMTTYFLNSQFEALIGRHALVPLCINETLSCLALGWPLHTLTMRSDLVLDQILDIPGAEQVTKMK